MQNNSPRSAFSKFQRVAGLKPRFQRAADASKRRSSQLRLEQLERRELLAADIVQNPLIAEDVNSDFRVTALDVLDLVNHIRNNRSSVGGESTATVSAATTNKTFLDVNGDTRVTPLDLLSVINKINADGVGEVDTLAEVQLVALDTNGDELPFQIVNGVKEYVVGIGQEMFLRKEVKDLRVNPEGVFGSIVDITLANEDASSTERLEYLYGEIQRFTLTNVNGGSFTLRYGSFETAPISIVTNNGVVSRSATAANIAREIGALGFVGGSSNLRVTSTASGSTIDFDVAFINDRIRTNIADPTVGSNLLTAATGTPTLSIITSINPAFLGSGEALNAVYETGVTYVVTEQPNTVDLNDDPSPSQLLYNLGPSGRYVSPGAGVFELDEVGAALDIFPLINLAQIVENPSAFTPIVDFNFRTAEIGKVRVASNVADVLGNGISLLDAQASSTIIPAENILFGSIVINVVSRIQAVSDVFPVGTEVFREDRGPFTLANVTANDVVTQGSLAGIVAVNGPGASVGTVSFTSGGNDIIFTPAQDFFGQAVFTYTVANSLGDTSVGTVTVNITPVNDPPVAITPTQEFTIEEDSTTALTISGSQVFLPGPSGEGGSVTFSSAQLVAGDTGGTVQIVGGQIVFTPTEDFNGLVRLNVKAVDQAGVESEVARVNVRVTAVNDAPEALGPLFSTNEDTNLVLPTTTLFSAGPANESGQTITLSGAALAPGQSGGTVSINGNGNLVFVPTPNVSGDVQIVVTGTDNGTPAAATVGTFTIRVRAVNDAPTADDDSYTVVSLTGVEQELDVLVNDSAGPIEPITDLEITRILNQSGNGTVRIAANGRSLFYTPASGVVTGQDAFTYEVRDNADPTGATIARARVTIEIVPPVLPFALRDSATIVEGTASVVINVLNNDLFNSGETRQLVSFTQPTTGLGTVTQDASSRLVYTPPSSEFFGQVVFTYTMTDTGAGSNPSVGQVTVTVSEVNDAPTVVTNHNATATEDVELQILGSTLLAGSSAGPLETSQTVTLQSARVISGGGTVDVRGNNLFFTSGANRVNNVIVEFTATDNGTTNGAADPKTATGTVTIAVNPVNDAPIAANDTANTAEDTPVTINATTILANDSKGPASATDEASNQNLTITGVQVISGGGTASIVNGNVRYVPVANANGPVVLEYTITDSEITATTGFVPRQATARINVTVTEVNDTPDAFTATREAFAGLATTIDLSSELAATSRGAANESSQTLSVRRIVPGSVQGGTAVLNANGTITFTATEGTSGTATFRIETIDNGTTNTNSDPKFSISTVNVIVAPFQPSSVAGVVWIDDDADSKVDSDERRLGGVLVTLTGTTVASAGGTVSKTFVTKADGSYEFKTLPPGTYTVSYVQPDMTLDGPTANSVTHQIAVPGGKNLVTNFSVLGVDGQMSSILDNLASGYFAQNPGARGKGIDAIIKADGTMAFSVINGGYDGAVFAEVVLSSTGRDAFVTLVGSDMSVRTAVVPRGKFFIARDSAGNTMVKIVALESELSFINTGATAAASASSRYLDSVDSFFANL